MKVEKKLTPLEEKWEEEKLADANKKPTLDDAYTADGKVHHKGLANSILDLIPQPTGWRIAILPYRGAKTTKGGIVLADETRQRTQLATNVGYVLKVGALAYADESKFPAGPWCKEGDWVIFGRYAGSRIQIDGGEIRLLNDDEVLGLVNDPDDILHM
jgi:co-chaperonin GroES (HSP10)|tara:strand:- start:310 stop:783 length:474 start_codon:yes stop_codon:yes gene_type:complete